MGKKSLGDRMKRFEKAVGDTLAPRMPTIVRVDGKAFHTFTKRLTPDVDPTSSTGFSHRFHNVMMKTARTMCECMQNVVFAYSQSDEISLLIRDYDTYETEQWFDGRVQKILSISAAMASVYFNFHWRELWAHDEKMLPKQASQCPLIDSRVFQLPKEEVVNYFIWRQQDATRNSINFIARKYFSHKKLHGKKTNEVQEMLWSEHNVNWNDYDIWEKRGASVVKQKTPSGETSIWVIRNDIPVFLHDKDYVNQHVYLENE